MERPVLLADQLVAFATFADHRNFTKAAAELHIAQPALHAKVASLSRALGLPLYERHGRQLVLTAEGEALATFSRDAMRRTDRFLADLLGRERTRPLVLVAGQGSYLYVIGAAVREHIRRHGHRLRLVTADNAEAVRLVRSGHADVAVAALDETPPQLRSTEIGRFDQVLALPKGNELANRRRLTLSDLDGVPLIAPPAGRPHRDRLAQALTSVGATVDVAVEAEGWPLMLHFAALGAGCAVVNGCVEVPRGVVIRPLQGLPKVTYRAVYRPDADGDSDLMALLACLSER